MTDPTPNPATQDAVQRILTNAELGIHSDRNSIPYARFMAAVQVTFRETSADAAGPLRIRYVNMEMKMANMRIVQTDLLELQRGALQRVASEQKVPLENIQDIVIMNISFLGASSDADYLGVTGVDSTPASHQDVDTDSDGDSDVPA